VLHAAGGGGGEGHQGDLGGWVWGFGVEGLGGVWVQGGGCGLKDWAEGVGVEEVGRGGVW